MQYELKTSRRAKSVRVTVRADGAVIVTTPVRVRQIDVDRFLQRHDAWIQRAVGRTKRHAVISIPRSDIARLKKEARTLAEDLAARYARRYGFTYRKISIRAQKTRWGSCSRAGDLSFNYKLAALPRDLAEYIVVHEVCHLGELNHSDAFWRLVEREVPEHRAMRKRLSATVCMFT